MKIFNKFIWSKKEPPNKNDIWFDGSTWKMYTEEAWQSFTLPIDAADKVAKVLENASEVYQEKLNAGYGIIIEGNTISVDDSNVWEAIETLQQNKVEKIQLNDYVPLDRYISTSQVLMDNISELNSTKLNKTDVATINGQSLIKGGNIVIPIGESYDDTEIKQQITELSAEIIGENITMPVAIEKVEGYNFFDKKYINTNASALPSPIAFDSASCMMIECKEGEQFSIYAKCTTSVVLQLWAFWRADYSMIEKSNIGVVTSFREEPLNITAPKDAAYLTINMYEYQKGDKVLKTLSISKKDIADELNKEDATSATPLFGKTIVCFGDSITEYADYNGKRYSDYISEFTGANVINVGVGGTRLEKRTEVVESPSNQTQAYAALDVMSLIDAVVEENFEAQFAAANSGYITKDTYLPIVQRLSEIDFSKVDAITIFAGTNSWRNSRALGTTGQRDSEYYILSAVNLIIERFSQKYPNIKIYWFLPIVRWIDNNGFTDANWCDNFSQSGYVPGDLSLTLGEFKDLVKTEVVKNHIPVCDLYNELGFNKFNFWNYFPRIDLGDRQTDGTHPLKGMNVIAKKIASFIQSNLLF